MNPTWQEIVWTLIALVSLLFNLWGLWDAIFDLKAAKRDVTKTIARNFIRVEAIRSLTSMMALMVGVAAILSAPGQVYYVQWIGPFIAYMLITQAGLVGLNSILDRRMRRNLFRNDNAGTDRSIRLRRRKYN